MAEVVPVASKVVRKLEESVRERENFGVAIMQAFRNHGGVELDIPARTGMPREVEFGPEHRPLEPLMTTDPPTPHAAEAGASASP